MTILFYGANKDNGVFSNFFPCSDLKINGLLWPTTEHFYQAQKSLDKEMQDIVRLSKTPHEAAKIGRYKIQVREDWDAIKPAVMYKAVYAKFTQDDDFLYALLDTGDEELVENTIGSIRPDPIWGNGQAGEGLNLLGKILMMVREELT